jgi:hypothetical protein
MLLSCEPLYGVSICHIEPILLLGAFAVVMLLCKVLAVYCYCVYLSCPGWCASGVCSIPPPLRVLTPKASLGNVWSLSSFEQNICLLLSCLALLWSMAHGHIVLTDAILYGSKAIVSSRIRVQTK